MADQAALEEARSAAAKAKQEAGPIVDNPFGKGEPRGVLTSSKPSAQQSLSKLFEAQRSLDLAKQEEVKAAAALEEAKTAAALEEALKEAAESNEAAQEKAADRLAQANKEHQEAQARLAQANKDHQEAQARLAELQEAVESRL